MLSDFPITLTRRREREIQPEKKKTGAFILMPQNFIRKSIQTNLNQINHTQKNQNIYTEEKGPLRKNIPKTLEFYPSSLSI